MIGGSGGRGRRSGGGVADGEYYCRRGQGQRAEGADVGGGLGRCASSERALWVGGCRRHQWGGAQRDGADAAFGHSDGYFDSGLFAAPDYTAFSPQQWPRETASARQHRARQSERFSTRRQLGMGRGRGACARHGRRHVPHQLPVQHRAAARVATVPQLWALITQTIESTDKELFYYSLSIVEIVTIFNKIDFLSYRGDTN